MNVQDYYWKQYQQTNLEEYHDKFKEIWNKVVYGIRESKNNIEKKKNYLVSKTERKNLRSKEVSLSIGRSKSSSRVCKDTTRNVRLVLKSGGHFTYLF